MPRYMLDDEDMAIMIFYLKSLSSEFSPGISGTTFKFATVITDDVSPEDRDAMLSPLLSFINARNNRKPTTGEVKSEVWMALIHGAKGVGYFCHTWVPTPVEAGLLQDKEMIAAVKVINERLTSLASVLNSPTTTGYASVSSSNTEVPVDIMTKKQSMTNYLFAVAMRPGDTKATFEVKQGKMAEVLGENRTIEIKNGKFTDDFSYYGVHLYKIK